jgi:hypothetical protein
MRLAPWEYNYDEAELRPERLYGRALLGLQYPDGRVVRRTVLVETSASFAQQAARILDKTTSFAARHPQATPLAPSMLDGEYYDCTTHRRTTLSQLLRDPRALALWRSLATPVSSAPAVLATV